MSVSGVGETNPIPNSVFTCIQRRATHSVMQTVGGGRLGFRESCGQEAEARVRACLHQQACECRWPLPVPSPGRALSLLSPVPASARGRFLASSSRACLSGLFITRVHRSLGESHGVTVVSTAMLIEELNRRQGHTLAEHQSFRERSVLEPAWNKAACVWVPPFWGAWHN